MDGLETTDSILKQSISNDLHENVDCKHSIEEEEEDLEAPGILERSFMVPGTLFARI